MNSRSVALSLATLCLTACGGTPAAPPPSIGGDARATPGAPVAPVAPRATAATAATTTTATVGAGVAPAAFVEPAFVDDADLAQRVTALGLSATVADDPWYGEDLDHGCLEPDAALAGFLRDRAALCMRALDRAAPCARERAAAPAFVAALGLDPSDARAFAHDHLRTEGARRALCTELAHDRLCAAGEAAWADGWSVEALVAVVEGPAACAAIGQRLGGVPRRTE